MGVVKTATFDADRLVVKAWLSPSAIRHFKIRHAIAIVSQIHHAVHFSRVRPFSLQFSDNAHSIPMRTARVLVFVDESNVVSSVRALGRKLDWLKLRDHLANADRGRELMEMVIYAGLPPPMPDLYRSDPELFGYLKLAFDDFCTSSTPASTRRALKKHLNPSIGPTRALMRRWSCSTTLLRGKCGSGRSRRER